MDEKVGVGVGIILLKNNKVLLGKRHDDPAKAKSLLKGAGTWTMPGGKLRFQESFEDAAKREVFEETGITLKKTKVVCINNDRVESAHFVTIGLLAEEFEGNPEVKEPEQIREWQWFDLKKLPVPLYFPSEKVLSKYQKKVFYEEK
ncbi:NUDIX domain-containing protein [Candidatus Woesearchaeota archaeon]|nr:MAG: NUDIX domain-containing protein [Candidatus Woesearchaeota archaeon]